MYDSLAFDMVLKLSPGPRALECGLRYCWDLDPASMASELCSVLEGRERRDRWK